MVAASFHPRFIASPSPRFKPCHERFAAALSTFPPEGRGHRGASTIGLNIGVPSHERTSQYQCDLASRRRLFRAFLSSNIGAKTAFTLSGVSVRSLGD